MRVTGYSIQATLLTLMTLSGFFAMFTMSAEDFTRDGIHYNITGENTLCVTLGPTPYTGMVVIPGSIIHGSTTYTVTAIDDWAFADCHDLTSIYIPSKITKIGEYAFQGCDGLTNLYCPSSVTTIGKGAFINCTQLIHITLPGALTSISDATFSNCSAMTNVTIPNTVTSIGEYAFSFCDNLFVVNIGAAVASIGSGAFALCASLTSINIPNSVTSIGQGAFEQCSSLKTITVPDSLDFIGKRAFADTRWLEMQNDGLVYIGNYLYMYKGDLPTGSRLTLNDSTRGIAECAFQDYEGLAGIKLSKSLCRINSCAFQGCVMLDTVTVLSTIPPMMDNSLCFDPDCYNNAVLIVPQAAVKDYRNTDYWNLFSAIQGWSTVLPGDANGDGKVSIGDVTVLIDYLLGLNEENIIVANADLNNDGHVSISDVTMLIDYLLSNK